MSEAESTSNSDDAVKINRFLSQKWREWTEYIERYALSPLSYFAMLDACYKANVEVLRNRGEKAFQEFDSKASMEEKLRWFTEKQQFDRELTDHLKEKGFIVYPLANFVQTDYPIDRLNDAHRSVSGEVLAENSITVYAILENAGIVKVARQNRKPPQFQYSNKEFVDFLVSEGILSKKPATKLKKPVPPALDKVVNTARIKPSRTQTVFGIHKHGENLPVPSNLITVTALSMIWGGGARWEEKKVWEYTEGLAVVKHSANNGGQILGSYDPISVEEESLTFEKVDDFIRGLSVRTGDVALAVLAALGRAKNPLIEPVIVSTEDIYKLKGSSLYGENRTKFDIAIKEEMERLQCLRFDANGLRGGDKRPITIENDRLFDILAVKNFQQSLFDPTEQIPTAWSVRAGHWAFHFFNPEARRWISGMAASLFAFSHRDDRLVEQLAKKIGQYVVLNFWRLGKGQALTWTRATLLEKIGESPDLYTKPSRLIDAFDEALVLLQEHGVFERVESSQYTGSRTKGWIQKHLSKKIEFVPKGMTAIPEERSVRPNFRPKLSIPKRQKDLKADGSSKHRIKQVREMLNINQDVVARELKISRKYLSDIENGKRIPSSALAQKLNNWIVQNPTDS